MSIFIKWLNRYGVPEPFHTDEDHYWGHCGSVTIPKRWLRLDNADLLTPLLLDSTITFPFYVSDRRLAINDDALVFGSNPAVPFLWIQHLRKQYAPIYQEASQRVPSLLERFSNLNPKVVFHAIKRPNITTEELDLLIPSGSTIPQTVIYRLFDCENEVVRSWAIERGLSPTASQLTEWLNGLMYQG